MVLHMNFRYDTLRHATLLSAALRYATLRSAPLRCATLRHAVLRCACFATLRCASLRFASLRYSALRYAALRCAAMRYAALRSDFHIFEKAALGERPQRYVFGCFREGRIRFRSSFFRNMSGRSPKSPGKKLKNVALNFLSEKKQTIHFS